MTHDKLTQVLTDADYRRLAHRLAQGLDVWVKGLHVVADVLLDDCKVACDNCGLVQCCDVDTMNVCGEVDDMTGYQHTLREIDDNPPARLV